MRKFIHGKECEKIRKERNTTNFCNGKGCGYEDGEGATILEQHSQLKVESNG